MAMVGVEQGHIIQACDQSTHFVKASVGPYVLAFYRHARTANGASA
ncbi:hypothetical protein [Neorhizobium huautlense]|nr:hypothetical protein [Neorhizobium huautlense]